MTDTFEITLNNPITEEQWDMITDVDFDRTDRIWFNTKHGKEVEFTKVTRCKDCTHWENYADKSYCNELGIFGIEKNHYCGYGQRKEK